MVTLKRELVNEYGEEVTVSVSYDGRQMEVRITANTRPTSDVMTPRIRAAIRDLMNPINFEPAYKDQTPA